MAHCASPHYPSVVDAMLPEPGSQTGRVGQLGRRIPKSTTSVEPQFLLYTSPRSKVWLTRMRNVSTASDLETPSAESSSQIIIW
ncbi:hypothetical protein ElyMa_001031000 [Elysia marginata]|uniref:Uncharacterized protein n=1 Tax=Elysia marginata TaxID=1093978 RepID=A0AAV4HQP6_9GAST|nr:hypothetical protein ElyMa_001031000 [Elysia marginata]